MSRPLIWSIAGLDTAGGAGLSADQRAADAMGVHLCPVVAALTAQHSQGVAAVRAIDIAWLDAQCQALADDLPPAAIKTGLLGSVAAVQAVARWVDRLRANHPQRPVALVVDPVLGASAGGHPFSDDAVVQAYRQELLPRATLITPNRAEARRLLGQPASHEGPDEEVPALAAALRQLGAQGVAITGGDVPSSCGQSHCLDWIDTHHAQGWLTAPRLPTRHHHGSGCTLASGAASALAWGHVTADALVLARMLTHHALMQGHPAGQGAGPVKAASTFLAGLEQGGAPLPWLGLGRELPWQLTHGENTGQASTPAPLFQPYAAPADGLYGIVDSAERIDDALSAGLRCVQLRRKTPSDDPELADHLRRSLDAAARTGATLFINDHWEAALRAPPPEQAATGFALGLHLGQEDLLALRRDQQQVLLNARRRLVLGLSSHSLWELARAAGCGASVVACGPVQATTTKDMPWVPQGLDNLRWWIAHSPVPVLAIGGLLQGTDLQRFAACGPAALCVVRGLGASREEMCARLPELRQAVMRGRQDRPPDGLALPHPVL